MTIKRKLFFSHIIMIVVPAILSVIIVSAALIYVYQFFWGGFQKASDQNFQFREQYAQVELLVSDWQSDATDNEQIIDDLEEFYQNYYSTSIALLVYQDGELVDSIGNVSDQDLVQVALAEVGDHTYVRDNAFVASFEANHYDVILFDNNYANDLYYENPIFDKDYNLAMSNIFIILLVLVLLVIYLMNRFLTKQLTTSITQPLEELAFGFQQIEDGDLSYQIDYQKKDEFKPLMEDFNQMAQLLALAIAERDSNENNRRELIAGISHDLRTPLTSIEAYIEGLEKGVAATPAMQEKYFATIKRKTKDMEHIINQLFLFSKLDTGEFPFNFEWVDGGAFLEDFVVNVKNEYQERGLELTLVTGSSATIQIDVAQLRSVLINLLENTLKYGADAPKSQLSFDVINEQFIIEIIDNGPGVATENLEQLFQLFYRSDQARSNPSSGSGLGLAIARKIIAGFGGEIKAFLPTAGGFGIKISLPIKTKTASVK